MNERRKRDSIFNKNKLITPTDQRRRFIRHWIKTHTAFTVMWPAGGVGWLRADFIHLFLTLNYWRWSLTWRPCLKHSHITAGTRWGRAAEHVKYSLTWMNELPVCKTTTTVISLSTGLRRFHSPGGRSIEGRTRWRPCRSVAWSLCRSSGRIL